MHYGKKALCVECWQPLLQHLDKSEQPLSVAAKIPDAFPVAHIEEAHGSEGAPGEFALASSSSSASRLLEEILREGLAVKNLCQWTNRCLKDSTRCIACQELWRLCLGKAYGRVAKKKMSPILVSAWEELRRKHFPRIVVAVPSPTVNTESQENEKEVRARELKSVEWDNQAKSTFMHKYIQLHIDIGVMEVAKKKDKKGIGCTKPASVMRWGDIQFRHGETLNRQLESMSIIHEGNTVEIKRNKSEARRHVPVIKPWTSKSKRPRVLRLPN